MSFSALCGPKPLARGVDEPWASRRPPDTPRVLDVFEDVAVSAAKGRDEFVRTAPLREAWAVLTETDDVGGPDEKMERFGVVNKVCSIELAVGMEYWLALAMVGFRVGEDAALGDWRVRPVSRLWSPSGTLLALSGASPVAIVLGCGQEQCYAKGKLIP